MRLTAQEKQEIIKLVEGEFLAKFGPGFVFLKGKQG